LATTSGGASSDDVTDWQPLAGRDVIIWADNDEAGAGYQDRVTARLYALGCAVQHIDIARLDLPPKGDTVDWLKAFAETSKRKATAADIWGLPCVDASNSVIQSDSSGLIGAGDTVALPDNSNRYEAITLCAADVTPQPISWLWDGWLAAGKFHVLAGAPGTGKTTLALSLAATITTAGRFPDGTNCKQCGNVLIWSGEDDPTDTLTPRLSAAGADLNRVYFLTGTRDPQTGAVMPFDPSTDMTGVEYTARRLGGVALLIIDPIVSATAGDSHKNAEVRKSLQPVIDLGNLLGCAVLGISHFSKGTAGRDPTERITGSLAFGALARVVMAAAKLSDNEGGGRLLCRTKSNIGADDGGVKYDLKERETAGGIFASYAAWGETVEGTARELLSAADDHDDDGEKSGAEEAADMLLELLSDGEMLAREATKSLQDSGLSPKQIRTGRVKIGVISKMKNHKGYWSLPEIHKTENPSLPTCPSSEFGQANSHRAYQTEDAEYAHIEI
jgi:energy-coupling factor transporter ATP-binding protein EcfA2